ncbi:MAG TPA: PP2C family serine/threonine-protein phosphatase [Archangium sp.]|uniref:PP2C family protein-serine/threonine phosphatase n=1 Tax=Archangium sp. TaxID=1872627 RepID=UPI002E341BA4|nr:PP2C family serine/threonine-protein phosphatase [Archangium sp.]HEX5747637.1 PP2C family serine/threonine-protein phosphatase [Archangium sp.]
MSLPLYIHGSSDVGRQRSQNEDSYRIGAQPDGSRLLVVCDGMGGHEAGEVASQVASDRLVEVLSASPPDNPPRALYEAFVAANQAVLEAASTRGAPGMGTTGVIAWVMSSRCYVGWVGDSRLYQFRDGRLIDRTRDHTRVAQMVAHGILTADEARNHPDSHVLVQALGGSPGVQKSFKPEVWTEPLELRSGDVVLLCSDGLYDLIEDHELYPLIEGRDYQDAVTRLIQTANERGGADNITVILLVAGQPEVPRMVKAPQAARRETLPDGMPMLAPELTPAPPVQASSEEPAPPAPAPRRPEPTAEVMPTAAAPAEPVPSGNAGRRVPLWWLLATGILTMGVGIALGLGAGSTSPSPSTPTAPAPVQGTTSVVEVDGGTEQDAGVARSGPPESMGTPHTTPVPAPAGSPQVTESGGK